MPYGYQRLCVVQTAGRVNFVCTFQRAVVAALRGTDNGSCRFLCTVLSAVCLCLFFIKRCLFTDLCQTRVGRWYDKKMSDRKVVDIVN